MVHARNAVLKGLSPKENREIPALRYEYVYRLKGQFPSLEFVLNGGISTRQQIQAQESRTDGVMLGRAAYHQPWLIADRGKIRAEVVKKMHQYCGKTVSHGIQLRHVVRHMLGLYHGHPRARLWRRLLSDAARLSQNDPALLLEAMETVESAPSEVPNERRTQAPQVQAG